MSLSFTTYRVNRLIPLGTSEPAFGSVDPDQPASASQLKLHERLFDRPMGLFVAGESLWMATRCQIWCLDNLLGQGQLHEGVDRLCMPAASHITGDMNAHEVVLGQGGQVIAPYAELTFPTGQAAIDRRNISIFPLLKRHLGENLSSISRSRLTQRPPLQPPPPQSSAPPEP